MNLGKKPSGGRYKKIRKKRLYEIAGKPRATKLGAEKKKVLRMRGGKLKTVLLATDKANVFNPKTKECKCVKIKNVLETPANKFFARTNTLIRGAIIETEIGKARITNRPSQEASVNALLLE